MNPVPPATTTPSAAEQLAALLAECIRLDASDLHLAPDCPPGMRLHGFLDPVPDHPPISAARMEEIAGVLLSPGQQEVLRERGSVDGAWTSADGTRFRINVYRRQGRLSAAIRKLEDRFRTLAELGLPDDLYPLADLSDGLVIVAGPTGAGKSTTLATLIHRVNVHRRCHIITIEDPVEYLHRPIRAMVDQREVHTDVPDFNSALVASLRQDPDVILVGEIRELHTIRTAITAAETGHLVFTTVHAGDCVGTIERLVSVFPADEQDGVRRQLSLVLRAIVTQHLLPGRSAAGKTARVVTSEILLNTPAVANLIAQGKSNQIYSTMETGRTQGMQTLEQDLARLVVTGRLTEQTAAASCRNANILRDRIALLRRKG